MNGATRDVAIAAIGIVSMIIARLLDWYFPLGRDRSRRQIRDDIKKNNTNGDVK